MVLKKWAKPESMKKTDRNLALRQFAYYNPWLSMREIGLVFGINKQRVSVILKGGQK